MHFRSLSFVRVVLPDSTKAGRLRRFVHGVFLLAAFDVLLRRVFRGVRVHLLTSGVNHDETVASRFYAAFVAHEFYHNGTISQVARRTASDTSTTGSAFTCRTKHQHLAHYVLITMLLPPRRSTRFTFTPLFHSAGFLPEKTRG